MALSNRSLVGAVGVAAMGGFLLLSLWFGDLMAMLHGQHTQSTLRVKRKIHENETKKYPAFAVDFS